LKALQPYLIAVVFTAAGLAHFRFLEAYEAIVPAWLPAHRELVIASGAFEILGALGFALRATRLAAGWGLIALLFAVFPANIEMAVDARHFASLAPPWALYARLPLQFVLMWWIYAAMNGRRSS